jgi:hypothetical protein
MAEDFTYEVWQYGIMVASATSPDKARARREAMRYLMQYAQDGKATLRGPDTEMSVEHSQC